MKKTLSFLLVFVMVAALFAGCGKTDQEKLVGTWQGEMDLTEALKAYMGEVLTDAEEVPKVAVTMNLSITEEGVYRMALDEQSVKTAIDSIRATVRGVMQSTLEKEYAEMGASAEDMMTILGMSMDEFLDEVLKLVDKMNLDEMVMKSYSLEGKCLAEEGKLYISYRADADPNRSAYFCYTLEGDVLTFTELVGGKEPAGEDMEMVFPMILKKIA